MRRCVEELVGAARTYTGSEYSPTEGEEGQFLQRLACSSVAANAASGDRPNCAGTDRRWSKVSKTLIDFVQVASALSHLVSNTQPHHRVGHELSERSRHNDRSPPRGPLGEGDSPHRPSLCASARAQTPPLDAIHRRLGEGYGPGTSFTELTGHMVYTCAVIGVEVANAVEGDLCDGRTNEVRCGVSAGRVDNE